MRVNVESPSSTEKKLEVFIPAEKVKEKFENVFKDFQQNARIKGFRPGKVPRTLIQSMFKDDIIKEVSAGLVTESLQDALKESSLAPVSKPSISHDKADGEREFRYTAAFEIIPEFTLGDYFGIPLKKPVRAVTDEDVDKTLSQLRERAAEARPLETEREARAGDYVIVDFEGTLEGKPVGDLKKSDAQFVVGEGKLIPEFEGNILGMKPGEERQFQVSYGEDFQIIEAAGKTIDYKLKLKDVRERYMPEANDDFAKEVGEESLDELKKKIKENLEKRIENDSRMRLKAQIVKTVLDRTPFDVPMIMVANETARIKREFLSELESRGAQLPALTEEIEKRFLERGIYNVKASIAVQAIADKENIRVEQAEMDERILAIAESYRLPFDKVKELYRNDNMLATLETNLIEDKVLNFLLEKAAIEEVAAEANQIDNEG